MALYAKPAALQIRTIRGSGLLPLSSSSTDNAAMIAAAGTVKLQAGDTCGLDLNADVIPAIGEISTLKRLLRGVAGARYRLLEFQILSTRHHTKNVSDFLYYAASLRSQPGLAPTPSSTRQASRSSDWGPQKEHVRTGCTSIISPSAAPAATAALDIGAIKLRIPRTMRRICHDWQMRQFFGQCY